MTLRGELHNRGSAGRCEACGEIFPCPTGLAIYEAVKREIEDPATPPALPTAILADAPPRVLYSPRWEELPDRYDRCSQCLHRWVSHYANAGPAGASVCLSMERQPMADRESELQRGVPPQGTGPRAYLDLRQCGCLERPAPIVECGYCKRHGRWAYPSVSADLRFCSSECEAGEDEDRARCEADAADEAAIARMGAEAATDDAFRLADQKEWEEYESLGVLSPKYLAAEDPMAPYVDRLLKGETVDWRTIDLEQLP